MAILISPLGVRMTWLRLRRAAAVFGLLVICCSCGDTFRPVAIPITGNPPTPASAHYVLSLSSNGVCPPAAGTPCGAGASSRIDVSGDTDVAVAQVGLNPVHLVQLPSGGNVYVANQQDNTVSLFSPSTTAPVLTISLPAGSAPTFLATTQSTVVYVANSGSNTVGVIPTDTNVVSQTVNVGHNPSALAELPNGNKLYAVNQADGTVSVLNTLDMSTNATLATGTLPVWIAARLDSQRVYVLNSGSGTVSDIQTDLPTDIVLGNTTVGTGANFMLYDTTRNRLYVTNPVANTLSILDASADPPAVLYTVPVAANPLAVAALPDETRVYVASALVSGGSVSSEVTVINAANGSLSVSPSAPNPISLTTVPAVCAPSTRFRLFATAAADSSRVYIGNCDAGTTSIIRTLDDTLLLNIPAPASALQSSLLIVSGAAQSGSNTTYTYTLTSGPAFLVGDNVSLSNIIDPGNNGTFSITALGNGTFTVVNPSGVTDSGQNGQGIVVPPQNPVFVLAGP